MTSWLKRRPARPGERDHPAVLLHGHLHRPEPLGVNGGNRWDLALEVLDGVVAGPRRSPAWGSGMDRS